MVKSLRQARKTLFVILGVIEFVIAALILVGLLYYLFSVPEQILRIPQGQSGFSDYLMYLFDALIGIELVKLICRNDLYSLVEILLFAVTRHLIMEYLSTIQMLTGILAIVALFAIRKFLFIHKETYAQEQHRREYME